MVDSFEQMLSSIQEEQLTHDSFEELLISSLKALPVEMVVRDEVVLDDDRYVFHENIRIEKGGILVVPGNTELLFARDAGIINHGRIVLGGPGNIHYGSIDDSCAGIVCVRGKAEITNCTIENSLGYEVKIPADSGKGRAGGGILGYNSNISISDSDIHSCAANMGGGIFVQSSSLRLNNVNINGNNAYDNGGGLLSYMSDVSIDGSRISRNEALAGGGCFFHKSNVTMKNTIILNNEAKDDGGGIFCADSKLYMHTSNVTNNEADSGGGINLLRTKYFIDDTRINLNLANHNPDISKSHSRMLLIPYLASLLSNQ